MKKLITLTFIFLSLTSTVVRSESDVEDVRRASQNPVSMMISLPFQNNTSFKVGPDDGVINVLNIQPVYPIELNKDWNLITRTILPIISRNKNVAGGAYTGIGDISFSAFFAPVNTGSKFIWGAGPIITVPTATDDSIGSEKISAGPSVVALYMSKPWVVGALVSQQWSIAGTGSAQDVSAMLIQPFITYNMDNGWYINSSPIITANWEASNGNKWTVPVGGGFGRVFRIGNQVVNAGVQSFYNVESTNGSGDWSTRFQIAFLFPKG